MAAVAIILSAIIAYFIGNINFATLISRGIFKKDVREVGSGSAGATNVFRGFGARWGFLVFFLDVLKGFVSYWIGYGIGYAMTGGEYAMTAAVIAGIMVIIGHNWPVIYRFKGGKGVSASLGVMLAATPLIGLGGFAIAVISVLLTNYMSVGSMAGALFAFIMAMILEPLPIKLLTLAILVLDVFQHRSNIKRLINGVENPMMSQSLLEWIAGKKR